jgi:type IV pilus assembly protein PilB
MVIAQRLMRTLCSCKTPVKREDLLKRFSAVDVPEVDELFEKNGCPKCNGSGYVGRTGIYEILESSDEMTEAINRRGTLGELRDIATRHGMKTLRERALLLCGRGVTTVDEVVRVTAE